MNAPLFPKRGAPRAIALKTAHKARQVRQALIPRRHLRMHNAASASALLADWVGTSTSANGVTAREAKMLRRRAKDLRENSAIVARYSYLCRDNILGPDGVTLAAFVPRPRGKDEKASMLVEDRWYAWAQHATSKRRALLSFLQEIVESWKIEGEGLGLMRVRDRELMVEALDADQLDQHYSEVLRNGHVVEQGVELDTTGDVVAFHLWDAAEDDQQRRSRTRWDAQHVLYIGHRVRPNQVRGITPLAPVMTLIQHLEKTDEALVVLNRTAASKMFQLVAQEWAIPLLDPNGEDLKSTTDDVGNEEVAPGAQWVPPFGYEAKTIDPGQPTSEYDALQKGIRRKISGGLNLADVSLSGDLSDANYGSQRGGLTGERDSWKVDQQLLIDEVLVKLFDRWLRVEIMSQRITLPSGVMIADVTKHTEWFPRRWGWIDPDKDAKSLTQLLALKMTSIRRELNKLGLDVNKVFKEIADDEALAKKYGFTLTPVATGKVPKKPAVDEDDADDQDDNDTDDDDQD